MAGLVIVVHLEDAVSVTFFFFNDTATTEIYTLSLHDALPISDLGSVNLVRTGPQRQVFQATHDLAMLNKKWNFVGSDFKNCTRAFDVPSAVPKPRIKESRVVDSKLAKVLVQCQHFRRPIWRHAYPFLRG